MSIHVRMMEQREWVCWCLISGGARRSDDTSWFSLGVTTRNGGMTGGGEGADVFVCSSEGLQRWVRGVRGDARGRGGDGGARGLGRFWMTTRADPTTQTGGSVDTSLGADAMLCEFANGAGRMIFTRT